MKYYYVYSSFCPALNYEQLSDIIISAYHEKSSLITFVRGFLKLISILNIFEIYIDYICFINLKYPSIPFRNIPNAVHAAHWSTKLSISDV